VADMETDDRRSGNAPPASGLLAPRPPGHYDESTQYEPIVNRHSGFGLTERALGGDAHLIAVRGELDLTNSPQLMERLDEAIDDGKGRIVVDMSGVSFLDSSTINALFTALARMHRRGGRLALVCPDPLITRVFRITGLDRLLPPHAALADALAALGAHADAHRDDRSALD
jgi:anti-sigma B factor antagonist